MVTEIPKPDRAEQFIHLFNQVQNALLTLTGKPAGTSFKIIVAAACDLNASVRANKTRLEQFAMLRNAIVHDEEYPPNIVAMPSKEALRRFKAVAEQILEPKRVIPAFACEVRCFSTGESLLEPLAFMEAKDFTQVVCRESGGRLRLITVEGITNWLRRERENFQATLSNTKLADLLPLEPPQCYSIMAPQKTVFDAKEAFQSIHPRATRLYAIIITCDGTDTGQPVGFVTPWDLVHNPRLLGTE
jgi:hypothetical protein